MPLRPFLNPHPLSAALPVPRQLPSQTIFYPKTEPTFLQVVTITHWGYGPAPGFEPMTFLIKTSTLPIEMHR